MAKKKKEEIENLLADFEKEFGVGTIIQADQAEFEYVKDVTSTGSLSLDWALGIGGIPKNGLLTQIVGPESSGKTTLALQVIAKEQAKGNLCLFIDCEGTIDFSYAKKLGVDLKKLHLVNLKSLLKYLKVEDRKQVSGEEWLDFLIKVLVFNRYGIIVLDSVAALVPLSEIEGGMTGAAQMARVGALLSKGMRNVNAALITSDTGLIFLNQYRMSPGAYGDPRSAVGGEALKYFTAVKIELGASLDKINKEVFGITVKGKIGKSKVSVPQKTFEYYIRYGDGVVKEYEIFELAVKFGFIQKSGSWFVIDGENKIQGEDAVIDMMENNPEYTAHMEAQVLARIEDDKLKAKLNEDQNDSGTTGDTVEEVGVQEEGQPS